MADDTPSTAQRVFRGVEAAVAPQSSAARAALRNAQARSRTEQSPDAPKPEEHVVVVTAPRIRPRARARGPSEADKLNEISLSLARGRQGPLAPGAETNVGRRMGYSKGGMVCPGKAGRSKPL